MAQFPIVPLDLVIARIHASLWADLARRGIATGERDLLIGATALARGMALATRDARNAGAAPLAQWAKSARKAAEFTRGRTSQWLVRAPGKQR